MSQPSDTSLLERVEHLMLRRQTGDMTPAELAEFEDLILNNAAARTLFAQLTYESVELAASLTKSVGHAPRDDNHPAESAREACPTPRKKSWLDRASRRPVRPALAVAVLVMVSVVSWAAVTYVSEQVAEQGNEPTNKVVFVAQLVHEVDSNWEVATVENPTTHKREQVEVGLKLFPGQKLELASGLAVFKFDNGADVVLEGPAEFEVLSRKACGLSLGKLVGRCLIERSKKFIVETPTATVKDLGTEFGVEVDRIGRLHVKVFDGAVDVAYAAEGGTDTRTSQKLVKGQTLALAADGSVDARAAAEPIRFVRYAADPGTIFNPPAEYVAAVKASGPVAYWRFESSGEGKVANEMGSGLPLRMAGGVRLLRVGDNNSVALFQRNRTASALVCDNVSAAFAGDYTFEAWVFPASDDHVSAVIAHVFAEGKGTAMMCELRGKNSVYRTPYTFRYLHRQPLGSTGGLDIYSKTRFQARQWYHVAAVRKEGTATLWLNGKEEGTARNALAFDAAEMQLVLGQLYVRSSVSSSASRSFAGYLDEVAIYDRALTPEEIRKRLELASGGRHTPQETRPATKGIR